MPATYGNFIFRETNIDGVAVVETTMYSDSRGFFMEAFTCRDFQAAGLPHAFVQENYSFSQRGVLRGMHFQREHPQAKLIRVLEGEVFDVAVDLRQGSASYGKSVCVRLSSDNHLQLLVPRGFAHGFMVTSPYALLGYLCDEYYHPKDEGGLTYNDPDLNIPWPDITPILSQKDKHNPTLAECPIAFDLEHPETRQ